ncbi:MAG: hydrogenase maturation protease [Candidatus Diapherotrites archaeon]|nr:hydrogenase maturation protease [Candidatus Diapherotrites archaeon]
MPSLEEQLPAMRKDSSLILLLGIGDESNPADSIGIEAVKNIGKMKLPKIETLLAGTAPENFTGKIRKLNPSHLIIVDAAEIAEKPGSIKIIDKGKIRGCNFSTHSISASFLMDYVEKSIGCKVVLIGIQPPQGNGAKEAGEIAKRLAKAIGNTGPE